METSLQATMTDKDKKALEAKILALRDKMPFLLDLTAEQIRSLRKLGEKNYSFVVRALDAAEKNPDMLKRSFSVEAMRRDFELYESMRSLKSSFNQLIHLIDDTMIQAGAQALDAAFEVYSAARSSKKNGAIAEVANELAQHFTRKNKPTPDKK